jgi:Fe-S cluster assembly iron-binding protein IscA
VLYLTTKAATLIRSLVRDRDLPAGAGLRIAQRDDHSALSMELTPEAKPEDTVLEDRDVALFLGPQAARKVDGQTLDAEVEPGHVAFFLR